MNKKNRDKILFVLVFLILSLNYKNVSALTIIQTDNISVTAIVGVIPSIDPPNPSTGGSYAYQSGVRFSGFAYPDATVTVQRKDSEDVSVKADSTGFFSISISETDWQLFSIFAVDVLGRRSTLLNFPTVLYSGYVTDITGIKFAPTIDTDKISVRKGDYLTIEGMAIPNQIVKVFFEGAEESVWTLKSKSSGVYTVTIPISMIEGDYLIRAGYENDIRTSKVLKINVGTVSVSRKEVTINIPGDCNIDQKITLVDFSVLAFWYLKNNPPKCVDVNSDGIINIIDFSIVAFYWNG